MGYPFPQVPYKVYTKTFLKDVHLIFKYSMVHPNDTILTKVRQYYEEKFRITTQDVDVANNINIKSKDELIWFDFKWDELVIGMKSPMYKSFDLTLEVMEYAMEFFKVVGVSVIEKVVFPDILRWGSIKSYSPVLAAGKVSGCYVRSVIKLLYNLKDTILNLRADFFLARKSV